MAENKIPGDGNSISIWWCLPNYASDADNPTAAEINAQTEITRSVAWANWSFGTQASNLISDPSIGDVGNVQTRGFAQFGGTISFFRPFDYTDTSNELLDTFLALSEPRTLGYIVIRVDGQKTTSSAPDPNKVALTGDFVSIYKVISDAWTDVITGEESFKYTITFQPQGDVWVNAVVGTHTVATPVAIGTADYSVGGLTPLGSYVTGRQLAAVSGEFNGTPSWFDWESDDPDVATVDSNGVVLGVSAGGADITATHKVSGVTSSALSVTIS